MDLKIKVRKIKVNIRDNHNKVTMSNSKYSMSMIFWQHFYLVVFFQTKHRKNKENGSLTRSGVFYMRGDLPKVHYGILS